MNCIMEAIRFAAKSHSGQFRKYTGRPYIEHPIRVMYKTILHPDCTEEMAIAAVQHDEIEDCQVSFQDISEKFGEEVANLVEGLTNPSKGSSLPRAERKAWDRRHLQIQPKSVKIIKLIDRIDNLNEMDLNDGFIHKYLRESEELAEVLKDGDEILYNELVSLIQTLKEKVQPKS